MAFTILLHHHSSAAADTGSVSMHCPSCCAAVALLRATVAQLPLHLHRYI